MAGAPWQWHRSAEASLCKRGVGLATYMWHWPAEASLRERGAGPAAYMQAYIDEDGPAKQVHQSLHHSLKIATLKLLKGMRIDRQSATKSVVATRRWHRLAEASLCKRGAGLAAYMKAYMDKDGPAKQVHAVTTPQP
jgi:hypothetical protein